MSHEATMWAVKVRGISCAEARVLWHLADCHNPVFGCYPTQEYLADACELDVRSIRRSLDALRVKGLINWVEQRERNKRRANRYSLGFEPGFRPAEEAANPVDGGKSEPDNLSGSNGEAGGQISPVEPDISDSLNRTQESAIEPVREPVKEPVIEREGAGAASDRSDIPGTADFEKRAMRLCGGDGYAEGEWKGWNEVTPGYIIGQFAKLSPEDRKAAEQWRDAFLAKCRRDKVKPMPIGNFLRDRAWRFLNDRDRMIGQTTAIAGRPVSADGRVAVPVFGPAWAVGHALAVCGDPVHVDLPDDLRERKQAMFDTLRRGGPSRAENWAMRAGLTFGDDGSLIFPDGFERAELQRRICEEGYPEANRLGEAAKNRHHVSVDARFERLKDLCEPVPVGSDMWAAWRDWHSEHNKPFVPEPKGMKVVYFPKGGPERLGDFLAAAERALGEAQARMSDDAA